MKVLVLGGTGFVGRVVARRLRDSGWAEPVVASRSAGAGIEDGIARHRVDTLDAASLRDALAGIGAVVNCVAGDGASIADGARVLCEAAAAAGRPAIVHLSSMAVYGSAIGRIAEDHALQSDAGWYAQAKIAAEQHVQDYARAGGAVTLLRPGCIAGPGSPQWSERIVQWLRLGWLGDLGEAGDGWSNLVHVDDVARCALAALRRPPAAGAAVYNLAAPDSPRWNRYFIDLALQANATPVRRIGARRLKFTAKALGIPLKVLERLGVGRGRLPPGIAPSLLGVWAQDIRLDGRKAGELLGGTWTPYARTVADSAGPAPL